LPGIVAASLASCTAPSRSELRHFKVASFDSPAQLNGLFSDQSVGTTRPFSLWNELAGESQPSNIRGGSRQVRLEVVGEGKVNAVLVADGHELERRQIPMHFDDGFFRTAVRRETQWHVFYTVLSESSIALGRDDVGALRMVRKGSTWIGLLWFGFFRRPWIPDLHVCKHGQTLVNRRHMTERCNGPAPRPRVLVECRVGRRGAGQ
jgi:hypothetical protein